MRVGWNTDESYNTWTILSFDQHEWINYARFLGNTILSLNMEFYNYMDIKINNN